MCSKNPAGTGWETSLFRAFPASTRIRTAAQTVRELGRVDVLMMPIDADYHILSELEISDILHSLTPRVLIPMHYRLPDLENAPDEPDDLGPIDPWLEGRANVIRLDTNRTEFRAEEFSGESRIVVFQHSPAVTRP